MAARASCSTLRRESIKPPWGFRPVNLCFFLRILIPALHEGERWREKARKQNGQKTGPSQGDWSVWVVKRSAVRRRDWCLAKRKFLGFDRKYERMHVETDVRIWKCWRGKLGATEWKLSEEERGLESGQSGLEKQYEMRLKEWLSTVVREVQKFAQIGGDGWRKKKEKAGAVLGLQARLDCCLPV